MHLDYQFDLISCWIIPNVRVSDYAETTFRFRLHDDSPSEPMACAAAVSLGAS